VRLVSGPVGLDVRPAAGRFLRPMFDDFAPKTVAAVKQAEELAQRLKDESVATGHLIYGLTVDKSVCLHHIFQDLNVDPEMFAGYVQSLPREPPVPNGPFNRHVHTVFQRAREAARDLGSKKVDPEHVALALLSVKAGSCYETLKEFSIDPEYVQGLIMQAMGLPPEQVPEWC
jgi:ATP-dependent Clp protease ATP-binding subunit ClpA